MTTHDAPGARTAREPVRAADKPVERIEAARHRPRLTAATASQDIPPELIRLAERMARRAERRGWGNHDDLHSAALYGAWKAVLKWNREADAGRPVQCRATTWAFMFIMSTLTDVRAKPWRPKAKAFQSNATAALARCRHGRPEARAAVAEFWTVALSGLTAGQAAAVVASFRKGLDRAETAAIGVGSESAVSKLLVRASPTLRANLAAYMDRDHPIRRNVIVEPTSRLLCYLDIRPHDGRGEEFDAIAEAIHTGWKHEGGILADVMYPADGEDEGYTRALCVAGPESAIDEFRELVRDATGRIPGATF